MLKRNGLIDITKFISACMVLFLHTINLSRGYGSSPIEVIDKIVYAAIWIINPVEFFFVISAYLLFSKPLRKNNERKFIKRLIILYCFWSLFYLENIVAIFKTNSFMIAVLKTARLIFLIGTGGHMWYVLGLIYAVLLLYPLLMRKKSKLGYAIGILLYMVNLLGDSYYHLIEGIPLLKHVFDLLNNGLGSMYLFRGFIFVMLGYYLATHKGRRGVKFVIPVFVLLGLLNNVELYTLKAIGTGLQYSITVLKPFTTFMLCYLVTANYTRIKGDTAFWAKFSTVLYFIHIFVRDIVCQYIAEMHIVYFIVLAVSLAITIVFDILARRKGMRWINNVC